MEKRIINLPAMYADHHVIEVKRLLGQLPGVASTYASSAFRTLEVEFDEVSLPYSEIEAILSTAGYMDDLDLPTEYGSGDGPTFFRKTAAFEQTGNVVGFAQNVPYTGRPLWPCPDIGPLADLEEVKDA